jgi:hypothetical protein
MLKTISIIGAGTYGSYLAHCMAEKYPEMEIHLFEAGNEITRSENEMGFVSTIKNGQYKAASDGRFFGLGGTSARWGGQLLFYSNNDFADDNGMREIIDCNISYRDKVLKRFFNEVPPLEERKVDANLFVKKGIWLNFRKRNLFRHFQVDKHKNIKIHKNARVIKLNSNRGKITSLTIQFRDKNEPVEFKTDLYYLTSGAFESLRLLHVSGITDMRQSSLGFSDHVSMRCFEIESGVTKIGSQDFQFHFVNGSMVTSRLVGEIDNVSFYAHPIFNEQFNIFQFLKKLIFRGEFNLKSLLNASKQFPYIFPFIYDYLYKKRLYVYGSWYLNIDIELSQSHNQLTLSNEKDADQQHGIDIDYKISADTIIKLLLAKEKIKRVLQEANIPFREMKSDASSLKLEDTYHPYRLFADTARKSVFELSNPLQNLYLFNTGLLHRSGGINPTAALFCLIEHHIDNIPIAGKMNNPQMENTVLETGSYV